MVKNIGELEFCMVCAQRSAPGKEVCECGSKNFVYGHDFSYDDRKVKCSCGNDEFEMVFHMNSDPIYTKNYKCNKCNNLIGVQTYYESKIS